MYAECVKKVFLTNTKFSSNTTFHKTLSMRSSIEFCLLTLNEYPFQPLQINIVASNLLEVFPYAQRSDSISTSL